jgi:low temperature requirement protein LtrA
MAGRSTDETHRVSTPLELLFDLTFVIAVAQAASELAHAEADGHVGAGVLGYVSVFFAIWWAWMNFTWFASAFDTDDVPYRLLTLVQMAGVLVLSAGIPAAFENASYGGVTVGYLIMRVALVGQWLRAARAGSQARGVALRYASGVSLLQLGWLLRLVFAPGSPPATASFLVLIALEVGVPLWAERGGTTSWHAHHIAERYGLFTIIVLGECVLAATTAVQTAVSSGGWSPTLVGLGVAALALLFGLWWLYFLRPAGEALDRRRDLAFVWGYGHFGIFAGLAALGAGLEVAGEAVVRHGATGGGVDGGAAGVEAGVVASDVTVALAVAIPVIAVLLLMWGLHAPLGVAPRKDLVFVLVTCAGVAVGVVVVPLGGSLLLAVAVMALAVALLVARAMADPGEGQA